MKVLLIQVNNILDQFLSANLPNQRCDIFADSVNNFQEAFLSYAPCTTDSNKLKKLLTALESIHKKNSVLFCRNSDGETALSRAVQNNNSHAVMSLLEAGASMINTDQKGLSPLHHATAHENTTILQHLLAHIDYTTKQKYDLLNIKDGVGRTLLSVAVLNNNYKAVKLLLEKGANMQIPDNQGFLPFHHAVTLKCSKILEELLTNISPPDQKSELINMKCIEGYTVLSLAVQNNKPELVKLLLQNNACMKENDNRGLTPLHHAALLNNTNVLDVLLTKISSLPEQKDILLNMKDNYDNTPLLSAILNDQANTALSLEGQINKNKMVSLLLNAGADVSSRDILGYTPLYHATELGYFQIVRMLLAKEKYSQLQSNDIDEDSPLAAAIRNYQVEIMEFFLDSVPISKLCLKSLPKLAMSAMLLSLKAYENSSDLILTTLEKAEAKKGRLTEKYREIVSLLLRRGLKFTDENDLQDPHDRTKMEVIISETKQWLSTGPLSADSLLAICKRNIKQRVKKEEDFDTLPLPNLLQLFLKG